LKNPPLTTFGAREEKNLADRDLFVTREGHVLLCCDLSSIDVRGMAWHAQDAAMIDRLQPGKDWHTEMAQLVFSDPSRRKDAKPLSHAVNYNAGPRTIAASAGISEPEAAQIIAKMAEALPGLWAFKDRVGHAAEAGEHIQNGWGRWMRPDRSRAFTTAPGLSGQGWARDALAECQLRLEAKGLGRYIVLSVHDELVFELPEAEAEALRDQIVETMTFDVDHIPVLCKASGLARRWSDCYRSDA
jgi:DNA polymerase-1